MRTKIRNLIMPLAVALIAFAGAFAGNLSSTEDITPVADRLGHTITCQPTSVMCTNEGGPICTDVNGNNLYDWNGTDCPLPLNIKF